MPEVKLREAVEDLSIVSLDLSSGYVDGEGDLTTALGFDMGSPDIRDDASGHLVGVSLSAYARTTKGDAEAFRVEAVIGCTTRRTAGEPDRDLLRAGVEACIGLFRSLVVSLSVTSLLGTKLTIPMVDADSIIEKAIV